MPVDPKSQKKRDELFDRVRDTLRDLKSIPTPGQIQALIKERFKKQVDYNDARSLNRRLKKLQEQSLQTSANLPAVVETTAEPSVTEPVRQGREAVRAGSVQFNQGVATYTTPEKPVVVPAASGRARQTYSHGE